MRAQSDGMTLPELGQEDIQALEESLSLADMKDKDTGTSDLRSTLMVHQQYVRPTLPVSLVKECAPRRLPALFASQHPLSQFSHCISGSKQASLHFHPSSVVTTQRFFSLLDPFPSDVCPQSLPSMSLSTCATT
jgi:hypothetical protein